MPLPLYFRGPEGSLPNRGRMLVGRRRIELRDCAGTCPCERRQRGWGAKRRWWTCSAHPCQQGAASWADDEVGETRSVDRPDGSSIRLMIRRRRATDRRSTTLELAYRLHAAGGDALAEEHETLVLWDLDRAIVRAELHKVGFDEVVEFEHFGCRPARLDGYTPVGLVAIKSR